MTQAPKRAWPELLPPEAAPHLGPWDGCPDLPDCCRVQLHLWKFSVDSLRGLGRRVPQWPGVPRLLQAKARPSQAAAEGVGPSQTLAAKRPLVLRLFAAANEVGKATGAPLDYSVLAVAVEAIARRAAAAARTACCAAAAPALQTPARLRCCLAQARACGSLAAVARPGQL